eukprot:14641356-Alexandrium_andersonii.AAC.1
MGPPKLIDPAHSNARALHGAAPGAKSERPGVSPFASPGRDPMVAGWEEMPKVKMPTDRQLLSATGLGSLS